MIINKYKRIIESEEKSSEKKVKMSNFPELLRGIQALKDKGYQDYGWLWRKPAYYYGGGVGNDLILSNTSQEGDAPAEIEKAHYAFNRYRWPWGSEFVDDAKTNGYSEKANLSLSNGHYALVWCPEYKYYYLIKRIKDGKVQSWVDSYIDERKHLKESLEKKQSEEREKKEAEIAKKKRAEEVFANFKAHPENYKKIESSWDEPKAPKYPDVIIELRDYPDLIKRNKELFDFREYDHPEDYKLKIYDDGTGHGKFYLDEFIHRGRTDHWSEWD